MVESHHTGMSARGQHVFVISIATLVIAGFFVILRLFTRMKILHFLGRDDACIAIALVRCISNEYLHQRNFLTQGLHNSFSHSETLWPCAFVSTHDCHPTKDLNLLSLEAESALGRHIWTLSHDTIIQFAKAICTQSLDTLRLELTARRLHMRLLSCILLASHSLRFLSCCNIFESLTLLIFGNSAMSRLLLSLFMGSGFFSPQY